MSVVLHLFNQTKSSSYENQNVTKLNREWKYLTEIRKAAAFFSSAALTMWVE